MTFKLLKQAAIGARVPMTVFDNLYAAKENDLKVILFVLKAGAIDVNEISRRLDITVASVISSLYFWADKGLVLGEADGDGGETKKRLSSRDILRLSKDRPEIRALVGHIQQIFGHALNAKSTETFVNLYVMDGVPVEVILILAMYYAPVQKGPGYTARTILNLYEKDGVTTAEKAENHIKTLTEREKRYAAVCRVFSLDCTKLTKSEKTIIDGWGETLGMSEEMIACAKETAGFNANIRYCNGILKSWSQKGYKKPSDINEIHNSPVGESRDIPPEEDIILSGMHIVPEYKKEN